MKNNRVLVVEDDPNLGKILMDYLSAKDYMVNLAVDGEQGLEKFVNGNYDILILDIMMPKKDGFSLAQDIRKVDKLIPIIFLTAKSQKENIIKAFKLGADDYLTKPFSIDELLARMIAVMKRIPKKKEKKLEEKFDFANFTFVHNQNLLIDNKGKEHQLTTKENELLKLFCLTLQSIFVQFGVIFRKIHLGGFTLHLET